MLSGWSLESMKYKRNNNSAEYLYRKKLHRKGFELVDITPHCEFKLGQSGWCNDFNEPDQHIYHVQIHYRDKPIANLNGNSLEIIDEELFTSFIIREDFIIYRKVKL